MLFLLVPLGLALATIASSAMAQDTPRSLRTERFDLALDAGTAVAPLPSLGLTAGYYVDDRTAMEASGSRGLVSLYIFSVRSEVLSLRVKRLWSDTFYTNLGLARRTIGVGFGPSPVIRTDVLDVEARVSSLAIEGSLGNRWQWEHWGFAIDWLGVLWPIRHLESRDDIPGKDISAGAERYKQRLFERLALGRSYSLLRLTVAYTF